MEPETAAASPPPLAHPMEQISYNRRNIGPLTRYGRFRSSSRSARRYTRGRRNSYISYSRLPARKAPVSSYTGNVTRLKKVIAPEAITYPHSGAGGAPTYYAKSWSLSQLDDENTYATVYDAYRIVGVAVKFTPRFQLPPGGVNNTSASTQCYVATDFDDDIAPTSQSSVRATGTCKIFDCSKPFKMFIRPRCTGAFFANSTFSGYSIEKAGKAGPWIDMANTNVVYYGLKLATAGTSAGFPADSLGFDIQYTFYVELRGQR